MLFLIAIMLAMVLLGCQGDVQHHVVTDSSGSLTGMVVSPEPQSLNIDHSADFFLDWDYGYAPPSTFDVKLEKVSPDGSVSPVLTVKERLSAGHYRFAPSVSLPAESFFLFTVSGNNKTARAMYHTKTGWLLNSSPRVSAIPGEEGKAIHTITEPPTQ